MPTFVAGSPQFFKGVVTLVKPRASFARGPPPHEVRVRRKSGNLEQAVSGPVLTALSNPVKILWHDFSLLLAIQDMTIYARRIKP